MFTVVNGGLLVPLNHAICLFQHDVHLEIFEHEDIVYGDVIGKGGEGIVRKCTVNYQGVVNLDAAVKTLTDNSADAISLTLEEIELLW